MVLMLRDEDVVEEQEVEGRVFRRLGDGQLVEVMADGSYERDVTLPERGSSSRSTDFDKAAEARQGEGGGNEPSDADKIRDFLAQKGGDERVQGLKKMHSSFAFKGNLKEILDATPKGTQLAGFHGVGGRHGMSGPTQLESKNVDPLKQVLVSRKPTTYAEHIRRLQGARDGNLQSTGSMQSSKNVGGGSTSRKPGRFR